VRISPPYRGFAPDAPVIVVFVGRVLALLYSREALAAASHLRRQGSRSSILRRSRARFARIRKPSFSLRQQGPVIQNMRDDLAASGLKEHVPDAYRQRAFEISVAGYSRSATARPISLHSE